MKVEVNYEQSINKSLFENTIGHLGLMGKACQIYNLGEATFGLFINKLKSLPKGWFSDRWSHYWACGKPVIAQSTGFELCVPTGRGLLSFSCIDEAVECILKINGDYVSHCFAARKFAEENLDSRLVLTGMLSICSLS